MKRFLQRALFAVAVSVLTLWAGRNDSSQAASGIWKWDAKTQAYYYLVNEQPVKSRWIGDYYLKADGKMARNEWFLDGKYRGYYYAKADGGYAMSQWIGNYYLKSNGKMASAEWVFDPQYQEYFYFSAEGSYLSGRW